MSTSTTYRMQFKNIEQKMVTVLIEDRPTFADNPYNFQYTIIDNGDGTQTVTFTWNALPGDIFNLDSLLIGYRQNTLVWTESGFPTSSPQSITIPTGDYDYRIRLFYLDDSTEDFELLLSNLIDLQPAGDPLHLKTIDNDEDKYTPIKAKQVVIQFLSDPNYNMDTFADGPEDRFKVTVLIEAQVIFYGFLTPDDLSESFLPPINVVTLIASDKLGALKDIPLTDSDGENPIGKYRIMDFIAMCLNKTALQLPIRVINNLNAGTGVTEIDIANFSSASDFIFFPTTQYPQFYAGQKLLSNSPLNNGTVFTVLEANDGYNLLVTPTPVHESGAVNFTLTDTLGGILYDKVYLDARTFESKIGESEDCETVLEKILGEDCFITQYKGEWLIVRVDEIDNHLCYVSNYTQDGVYVDTDDGVNFYKLIGFTESIYFSQEETTVSPQREYGIVKEEFRFETWQEVVCNIDFSRGDVIDDTNPLEITYDIECWTQRRGLPGFYNVPITITDFITRIFDLNDYEKERFISITPQTGHAGYNSTDDEYIESQPIQVQFKDKLSGSIDWKFDSDIASSSATLRLFRFVLIGDDGSGWILGEDSVGDGIPIWYDTSGFTINSGKGGTGVTFGSQDETEWQSISWEVPPIPVNGNLYIWLGQAYNNGAVPSDTVISYSNLNVDYIPYINGSYRKYVSQYNKVSRSIEGYLAKRENQVFISDSPKPIFKGAMFLFDDPAYVLTNVFYDASKSGTIAPSTPSDSSKFKPYGYLQAFSVWNQFRLANRNFNYTFQGDKTLIGFGEVPPDLINKYWITDISVHSNDRWFMDIHFDHDLFLCESKGLLAQVYLWNIGKLYSDPHEFKYESENR